MQNDTKIPVPEFNAKMDALQDKVSPPEVPHLEALLDASSTAHGQSWRAQRFAALKEAEGTVEHLREKKADNEDRLAVVRRFLASLPSGSWVVGVVFIAGFIAAFGSEIVFNAAILPWILDVSKDSILGLALSIAPATAPLILDRILARLLGVGDPVEVLAKATGLSARVRRVAQGVFMAVAGIVTLYGVWVLGSARAVAQAIINDPNTTGMNPQQQHIVNLSLLLVSLVLTVNGALFYLFGVHELRNAFAAWKARREIRALDATRAEIGSSIAAAVPKLEDARNAWANIDAAEKSVVDAFLADGKSRLARALARPADQVPAAVRSKRILDERLAAAAAA
jgi:hypothetical protein